MKTNVDGRFWLNVEGKDLLGLGRIELLEQIEATGSMDLLREGRSRPS